MSDTHFDVLIIGAGLSGIGMASYLTKDCPNKTYAILERRQAIGGTWDLFRYPGIRSDSDMTTFGYKLRPWNDPRIFADGTSIREYLVDLAEEYNVEENIKFGLKTIKTNWSSKNNLWTVHTLDEATGQDRVYTCNFLVGAVGYYNYDQGHSPEFEGAETFKGQQIHPQFWPEDLDYKGKKVVVIGSGATAVTLLPAMADDTAHITMLQRSPSYVFSLPAIDFMAKPLSKIMPDKWVYNISRARNIFVTRAIYKTARRFPNFTRKLFLRLVRGKLGRDYDMTNFTPSYMPWDERLCMVPDGDLLKTIRDGKASVVTDHIDRFTENGILLKSGKELEADIIVTATGLQLEQFGGIELTIDDKPSPLNNNMTYKAALVENTPNFAVILGYINISWTLKAEMVADYVCRLINEMDKRGVSVVTPRAPDGQVADGTIMDAMQSGYIQRTAHMLPKQGKAEPWQITHHFEKDRTMYRKPIEDPALEWSA